MIDGWIEAATNDERPTPGVTVARTPRKRVANRTTCDLDRSCERAASGTRRQPVQGMQCQPRSRAQSRARRSGSRYRSTLRRSRALSWSLLSSANAVDDESTSSGFVHDRRQRYEHASCRFESPRTLGLTNHVAPNRVSLIERPTLDSSSGTHFETSCAGQRDEEGEERDAHEGNWTAAPQTTSSARLARARSWSTSTPFFANRSIAVWRAEAAPSGRSAIRRTSARSR